MKRYSEFINFPIYLWASKEVDVEVPADEDVTSEEEESCMHYSIENFSVYFEQLRISGRNYDSVLCLNFIRGLTFLSLLH